MIKSEKIKVDFKKVLLATVFFAPAYLVRVDFFGFSLSFLDCLAAIALLLFWIQKKKENLNFSLNFWPVEYFFPSIFIFLGFFLSLARAFTLDGMGLFVSWIALPIILGALLFVDFQKKDRIFFLKGYYSSVFLTALISLFYWFFGEVTFDGRLQGMFNSPNYLAMYLSPALTIFILSGNALFLDYGKSLHFVKYFSFLVIGVVIFLTHSYAAWLAIFLSLFFVSLIQKRAGVKKTKKWAWGVIILSLIFWLQKGSTKLISLISLDERSSFSSRLMIWYSARKIILDNWFWGVGLGNFQSKYLEYQVYFKNYLEWAVPHPHNIFLSFWAFGGLIGFLGFILLTFFWLKEIMENKNADYFQWACLSVVAYFIFHGLVDTTYFKNDLALIFWVFFVLSLKSKNDTLSLKS